LSRLLERLMEVCLATAGAQRGALLLEEDGRSMVRVVGSVSEPVVLTHTPLAASNDVPRAVIEHVRKTGDSLVLADALHHPGFATDPYVVARGVQSVVALPIRRQAHRVGILYLENDLATHVFIQDRLRVLQL